MHEASLHDENIFITLTYDDEHIPDDHGLRKRDFQLFMKRLRERYSGRTIRYYHCGEYGARTSRPHYHALLFGFSFPDQVHWSTRDGYPVWKSDSLQTIWGLGQTEIGSVTFESAAYVSRYMLKKFKGDAESKAAHYRGREPEYATMSLKPSIGKEWFEKFGTETYIIDRDWETKMSIKLKPSTKEYKRDARGEIWKKK